MPRSSISIKFPLVKTIHKQPYPGISPLRPELSQAGRTVLVVGGSTGIGLAIAKGFLQAGPSQIILTGRRKDLLDDAVAKLKSEAGNAETKISSLVSDLSDLKDGEALWEGFKRDGIFIDVLVLNAMSAGEDKPLLQASVQSTWAAFETNVRGLLDYTQRFDRQGGEKKKYLVNVSTSAVHNHNTDGARHPTYALTKNAGTLLIQQIAKDTDPENIQIINFHPGSILTDAAKGAGWDENTLDWDDETLPGQFAVWCASNEARFLHGRWVAAWWDVDELKSGKTREKIEAGDEYHFLRIGLVGVTQP